jgi:hypothetical protein
MSQRNPSRAPFKATNGRLNSFALALACAAVALAALCFSTGLTRPASARQAAADTVRVLPLVTGDLVCVPGTQTIYASVPGWAGAGGNSITPINPAQSSTGTPVFVGSEPGEMAASDDGRYIYVGLDGASAVRRYDIAASTSRRRRPTFSSTSGRTSAAR